MSSPANYTFLLIWLCHSIGAGGIFTVLPTVLYQLGLTRSAETQLMGMPLCFAGSLCLLLVALAVHKRKITSWIAALCLESFVCVCYIILTTLGNPVAKYVIITLASAASFGVCPILWPERIRAAHGSTSAGLAIGLTTAASAGSFGIVGPQIYRSSFGPTYHISFKIVIALLVTATISIAATWFLVRKQSSRSNGDGVFKEDSEGSNLSASESKS